MKLEMLIIGVTLTVFCVVSIVSSEGDGRYNFWSSLFGLETSGDSSGSPPPKPQPDTLYELKHTSQGPCFHRVSTTTTPEPVGTLCLTENGTTSTLPNVVPGPPPNLGLNGMQPEAEASQLQQTQTIPDKEEDKMFSVSTQPEETEGNGISPDQTPASEQPVNTQPTQSVTEEIPTQTQVLPGPPPGQLVTELEPTPNVSPIGSTETTPTEVGQVSSGTEEVPTINDLEDMDTDEDESFDDGGGNEEVLVGPQPPQITLAEQEQVNQALQNELQMEQESQSLTNDKEGLTEKQSLTIEEGSQLTSEQGSESQTKDVGSESFTNKEEGKQLLEEQKTQTLVNEQETQTLTQTQESQTFTNTEESQTLTHTEESQTATQTQENQSVTKEEAIEESISPEITPEELPSEETSEKVSLPKKTPEELPSEETAEEVSLPEKTSEELPSEETAEEVSLLAKTPEELPSKETAEEVSLPEKTPEELPSEETPEELLPEKTPEEVVLPGKTPEEVGLEEKTPEEILPEKTEKILPEKTEEILPEKTPEEILPEKIAEELSPEKPSEEIVLPEETSEVLLPENTPEELSPEKPSEEIGLPEETSEVLLPENTPEELSPEKTSEETVLPEKTSEELSPKETLQETVSIGQLTETLSTGEAARETPEEILPEKTPPEETPPAQVEETEETGSDLFQSDEALVEESEPSQNQVAEEKAGTSNLPTSNEVSSVTEKGLFPMPSNPPAPLPTIPGLPETQPGAGSSLTPSIPQTPSGTGIEEATSGLPGQSEIGSIPQPELPDQSVIETIPQPGLPDESTISELPSQIGIPELPNPTGTTALPTLPGQLSLTNEEEGSESLKFNCNLCCACSQQVSANASAEASASTHTHLSSAGIISDEAEIVGVETCAGLPPGPFVPPGYYPVDSELQQQKSMDTCGLTPITPVDCTMADVFVQLRLRVIYELIVDAGLEKLFAQSNNYTFFAPVDPAFDLIPAWFMQSLRTDKNLLIAFITNHLVKINLPLESLGNEFLVMNFRGSRIRINVYSQNNDYRIYTVDGSRVLQGGVKTTTGLLHIVDKVIMPIPKRTFSQYLSEIPDFSKFLQAVTDAGMLPDLDETVPYTVFIPVNSAFKSLDYSSISADINSLKNFVNYHIVNETQFSAGMLHGQYFVTNYYKEIKVAVSTDGYTRFANRVNGHIRIIKSDIVVLNGVAHVIEDCITNDPNFFTYEELSEFSSEFGSFRRRLTLTKEEEAEDLPQFSQF